jgi:hypothetical protein
MRQMTTRRSVLAALAILAVLAIAGYLVGDPRTFGIRRQVVSQLMAQLPKTDTTGGALEGVEITRLTHGPKGYGVVVTIRYDNSTAITGFDLVSDGFGRLTCNTVGSLGPVGPISLSIAE